MEFEGLNYLSVDDAVNPGKDIIAWEKRPYWEGNKEGFTLRDEEDDSDLCLFGLHCDEIEAPSWATIPGRLYASEDSEEELHGTSYLWDGRYWGEIENAYATEEKKILIHRGNPPTGTVTATVPQGCYTLADSDTYHTGGVINGDERVLDNETYERIVNEQSDSNMEVTVVSPDEEKIYFRIVPDEDMEFLPEDYITVTIGDEVISIDPDYEALFLALFSAFDQGAYGKGKERHGNGLSYEEQPISTLPKQGHGLGGLTFQMSKKAGEANTLLVDKGVDAAIREIKGVINYGAAALIYLESLKEERGEE